MSDTEYDTTKATEEMENIPVLLGYNGSGAHAFSVAFFILVAGLAALNARPYAQFVLLEQPFVPFAGWKIILGHLAVCAGAIISYWFISRQSMDILPKCFTASGSNSADFLYSRIRSIDVLRDFRGRVHLVFLKAEGMKVALGLGALNRMDEMSDSLVGAVQLANPSVTVQHKTRPRLILTVACGVSLGLLTQYYLWITVGFAPHTAPLLPIFPAVFLFCLELGLVGILQWTLAGYRISTPYIIMSAQVLLSQVVYLFLTLFVQHTTGGRCC